MRMVINAQADELRRVIEGELAVMKRQERERLGLTPMKPKPPPSPRREPVNRSALDKLAPYVDQWEAIRLRPALWDWMRAAAAVATPRRRGSRSEQRAAERHGFTALLGGFSNTGSGAASPSDPMATPRSLVSAAPRW